MKHKTAEQLIAFEDRICKLWEDGELPYPVYFSVGSEAPLIEIFKDVRDGDYIFSTHRSHYHYLLSGGSEEKLEKFICDGNGLYVFDQQLNFFTSSIVGGTPAIAAGVALSLQMVGSDNRVWCFIGDGATDEGNTFEAMRYVQGRNLPCTFVIENNDRSVVASKSDRWGDGNYEWPECVLTYSYSPKYPHTGNGCKKNIVFKDK